MKYVKYPPPFRWPNTVSHRPVMGIIRPRERQEPEYDPTVDLNRWLRRAAVTGVLDSTTGTWPEWMLLSRLHEEATAAVNRPLTRHYVGDFIRKVMVGIERSHPGVTERYGRSLKRSRHLVQYRVGPYRNILLTGLGDTC